jgi:SPP1 family predicted phage head-tail adaptor
MTSAGRMNRQITIERKSVTQDAVFGTEVVTWIPLSTDPSNPAVGERYWAEVQDALPSRSEAVTQGLAVARNQTRIRFRWRDDVDNSMRVTVHGDTDVIYQIVGGPAEIAGRKEMLEIVCEKFSS